MRVSFPSLFPFAVSPCRPLAFAGILACATGAVLVAGSAAYADPAACKAMQDAMIANTKTPYHSFAQIKFIYSPLMAANRGPKLPTSQSSETIFTGTAVYVRLVPGKWRSLPITVAKFQENVRASVTGLKECQHFPDEKVNGAMASVYEGVATQSNGPVRTKVWMSAQGVPIKSETDVGIGDGHFGHQHLSTRYEYGNVQAPSLTQ
jgi:hypothetical protein